ncbi:MAG: hypothetical protein Q8J62_09920 [Candidatus Cloacimonadaceae bacterium]|nr:hypothetical protein [Candidatus Cloacimonadaceae bacterium]
MPDHMKMQLNISGLAKLNDNLPLVRVGKFGGNSLILRLVYPSISLLQPFNTLKTSQKLMLWLRHYANISLSIPTQ